MIHVLLGAVALAGTVAMVFYIRWIAWYVGEVSTSVESNALHFLGWIGILLVVVCAEAVIVRDVYRYVGGEKHRKVSGRDEVAMEIKRQITETKILWTVYVAAPALLNLVLMNFLSGGFLFSGMGGFSQYATIATMLRSDDENEQLQGIEAAVASDNRKLGTYLADIIEERGAMAQYAAWATGMRRDFGAKEALRKLYLKGDKKQRASAIIALSEMKDFAVMEPALEDLKAGRQPTMNIIIGLGNVPYLAAEDTLIEMAADVKKPEPVRAACFWAISKMEQQRFREAWERDSVSFGYDPNTWKAPARKGWEPMVAALKGESAVLRCAAAQAMHYTGPPETSRELIEAFEAADKYENCKRLAIQPYKYKVFEVVQPGLFRSAVIRALAGVGDRNIVTWLDRVADDRSNADEVILLARDLARQIRNL
jgi:hypothetical protein